MTAKQQQEERHCHRHRRYRLASCPLCALELRALIQRVIP